MTEVVDDAEKARYEILVDGQVAGFAEYRLRPGKIVFTHTVIRDEFEGKGLGSKLVSTALDRSRDAGLKVVPLCPFVAGYIERHPDYLDLVDDEHRATVESAD
ncbi:GNAT family N-acetyltransferase [Planotetraspora phitsanulokensis]|uniref:N-acetyltransferase n=1 Tax=Planotetraspora phitsanulokensis TaxID=575192 RepID=A0A8J3XE09_9ACTN|nr:GNAT family N-acetyltransferase [Planotetraspora phitsanulokensis]GII37219.1 N-acetyltransferase [Planotetraspora phitsanulokensis]